MFFESEEETDQGLVLGGGVTVDMWSGRPVNTGTAGVRTTVAPVGTGGGGDAFGLGMGIPWVSDPVQMTIIKNMVTPKFAGIKGTGLSLLLIGRSM